MDQKPKVTIFVISAMFAILKHKTFSNGHRRHDETMFLVASKIRMVHFSQNPLGSSQTDSLLDDRYQQQDS